MDDSIPPIAARLDSNLDPIPDGLVNQGTDLSVSTQALHPVFYEILQRDPLPYHRKGKTRKVY